MVFPEKDAVEIVVVVVTTAGIIDVPYTIERREKMQPAKDRSIFILESQTNHLVLATTNATGSASSLL